MGKNSIKMVQPNFIMVGAPKAGTTSIAAYLDEHPEIFMSAEKEPFYFLPNILKNTNRSDPMYGALKKRAHLTKNEYYGLFKEVTTEKRIGEASVNYLYYFKTAIPNIKKEIGDAKIIICLRNPIQRGFSNYKYLSMIETVSFENALDLEEKRKAASYNSFWLYKEQGLYAAPVKAYLENFTNVHICFFEDFKNDPLNFMNEMYQFLEVDNDFKPNWRIQHNSTVVPRNKLFHSIYFFKNRFGLKFFLPNSIKAYLKKKLFKKNTENIKPQTSNELKKFFKSDVMELEELLGKNLSHWYS